MFAFIKFSNALLYCSAMVRLAALVLRSDLNDSET